MANPITYPNNFFLGAGIINPRVYYAKIKEIIDNVNNLSDGSISTTSLALSGALTQSLATDSTSTLTGAITTVGGVGILRNLNVGGTIGFTSNITGTSSANHIISVTDQTAAATAGANMTLSTAKGATSGAGGILNLISGEGGATGAGGVINITSGAGGATSGASGAINLSTGAAVVGSSGTTIITSGNTASGVAGDVRLTTGTHTSVTVCPVVSLEKAVVNKPAGTSKATGTTSTAVELLGGIINVTGATGTLTLPTGTEISTAIGSVSVGTNFDVIINAVGMTATNVVTVTVAAGITVPTTAIITGSDTLTVAQDVQVIGTFRFTNVAANTWKLFRIS